MIGLPHRVGAALVVFGQANGSEERKGHVLNPPTYYEGGFHTYFGNYPVTTPSHCIVKTAGTLSEDYVEPDAPEFKQELPKNALTIVCYKTELNHIYPDAAKSSQAEDLCITDSSAALVAYPPLPAIQPPAGNTGYYIDTSLYYPILQTFYDDFYANVIDSFHVYTDVTNLLDEPPPENTITPLPLYPRWKDEDPWDRFGYDINEPLYVTPEEDHGDPFYQTREGPASEEPATQTPSDWICPWKVAFSNVDGLLYSQQQLQFDYSFKFSYAGTNTFGSVERSIVYPWEDYSLSSRLIADKSTWTRNQGPDGDPAKAAPEGEYVTVYGAFGDNFTGETVKYESKSTHGLFLTAKGSCWNLGTVLEVKVYIWKAPPKKCFFPNNFPYTNSYETITGAYSWLNWKNYFTPGFGPDPTYQTALDYNGVKTNLPGPINGRGTEEDPQSSFQTGIPTGTNYTHEEPKAVHLHYWGCAFAPDREAETCVEVEVLEFTVTVGEDNTYLCDGTEREGVEYTPFGVRLENIELPVLEGFITYIKDFEVTSVKAPGVP